MDGRVALKLSMCLLIAAAGCQQEVMTLPGAPPPTSFMSNPDAGQARNKKTTAKPKDVPPFVLVSYGNFEAGEAFSDRTGPERQQQLCESARTDYEKALAADPKCVSAYQGLARLYTSMQDLPLAVETYQKALKLAPHDASLWYELGLCHNYQKHHGPALDCLNRAAQIEPGNRNYTNALGVVLAESGHYKESLQCFVRSGGEAMGYYRLAQTLRRLHKPEMSQHCMEVAVQKDPNLATPIQQTSYQPAATPPEPSAPPQQALMPPVPLVNGDDEQAEP
jgi:tetratricopeptide (TPR) repeat protein